MISRATNILDEAFRKAEVHLAKAKCEREFDHNVCVCRLSMMEGM